MNRNKKQPHPNRLTVELASIEPEHVPFSQVAEVSTNLLKNVLQFIISMQAAADHVVVLSC